MSAPSADALLARAAERLEAGHHAEARADLSRCVELARAAGEGALVDAARVELALLDVRERRAVDAAIGALREVLEEHAGRTALRARALHALGLAEARRRRSAEALDALHEAAEVYGELGDRRGRARTADTLATTLAAKGRLDHAFSWYARSLVAKHAVGDRAGVAVTLGGLGRAHLKAGQLDDALECFRLDLELCEELGDELGRCRMHGDLARAHLERGELEEGARQARRSLAIAEERGYRMYAFYARRDLALLTSRAGRADEAREELDAARALAAELDDPALGALLDDARGELLADAGEHGAVDALLSAARALSELDLPDFEIPVLLRLARTLCERGRRADAELALRRALALARLDGFARYLPELREAMAALSLTESLAHEDGRLSLAPGEVPAAQGYELLERIGSGAYGDVYRAFDPQRGAVVAVKVLRLERLYDPRTRRGLEVSARCELDAASRVSHPGVARVLAVGSGERGEAYVVQELVDGRPLDALMREEPRAVRALTVAARIAEALVVLHGAGVVHRDLKPGNVIVRRDGSPVLVDFGIAHVPTVPEAQGILAGTVGYIAPEQARGEDVDGRADVYALGAIVFRWLSGELPIEPPTRREGEPREPGAALREAGSARARRLSSVLPDAPPEVDELLARLLAFEAEARPDAGEAARECAELALALATRGS